jgi:hypothetical protein
MNLVLKFLAALAGVDPVLLPSPTEALAGAKVVTCAWFETDSSSSQTRRLCGENLGQSAPEAIVPRWSGTGPVSESKYGAPESLEGQTVMRDVSFRQMVIEVST